MSKSSKDSRAARSSTRSTQSSSLRAPTFLSRAAPTVSTSTSVGLSLAGLPSTPSPILIGPGREEAVGYFGIQPRSSTSSHGSHDQAPLAKPATATAEGHFITNKHHRDTSSSTSSSQGASGLLAALNDSIDGGESSHVPPSPGSTAGEHSPLHKTPGVRFTNSTVDLGSRGSVDTFVSRGSVSSFVDDVSSSQASPVPHRSGTPESILRTSSPRPRLPTSKSLPKLQHAAVKRTQSGHGLVFVPSPAAPATTSASSSSGSSVPMPRSRSTTHRLAEVLAGEDIPSSTSRSTKSPTPSIRSDHAQGAQCSLTEGDAGATPAAAATVATGAVDKDTRKRKAGNRTLLNSSKLRSTASSPPSSMALESRESGPVAEEQREDGQEHSHRSGTSSPSRSDSRGSGKYRTPSSSVDGDVFYTPSQRLSNTPGKTRHSHQKRNSRHWMPTGASDSDEDMQLNDVEENASGSSASDPTSLASSTVTELPGGDRPHSKVLSVVDDPRVRYIPPYQPRKRTTDAAHSSTASSSATLITPAHPTTELDGSHRFAITLVASLGSQSADGLPFNHRRMELELLWDEVSPSSLWRYVPGSRYIPQWRLRPAGSASGYEQVGLVRTVVGKLPVVGSAAAAWL